MVLSEDLCFRNASFKYQNVEKDVQSSVVPPTAYMSRASFQLVRRTEYHNGRKDAQGSNSPLRVSMSRVSPQLFRKHLLSTRTVLDQGAL